MWHDRFGDDIDAFERDPAVIEPLVDRTHVYRTFHDHRETTFDEG